ncbi:MAG: hypothetical protein ABI612_00490 [Betaproteobacteria bacterium]
MSALCPIDCAPCRDPECRVEGCKRSGEAALFACVECGSLLASHRLLLCIDCLHIEMPATIFAHSQR